jgi:hypothetical protein
MPVKYSKIRRTATFLEDYAQIRIRLQRSSPLAYQALPHAMKVILDFIDKFPRAMPIRHKNFDGEDVEFHLAIVDIAHRRLHVRYHVDQHDMCFLMASWIDGDDEPDYDLRVLNS